MSIGCTSVRVASSGATIPQKLVSLLMTAVLLVSLAPSTAWAQPGESVVPSAKEAPSEVQSTDESVVLAGTNETQEQALEVQGAGGVSPEQVSAPQETNSGESIEIGTPGEPDFVAVSAGQPEDGTEATSPLEEADVQEAPSITVTCSVIGVDANGSAQIWAPAKDYRLNEGATASDLSETLFEDAGLIAQTGVGPYGWYLTSIASPYTGDDLESAEVSSGVWAFWQLFVNDESSMVGAGSYVLQPGDSITWYYTAAPELPAPDVVVPDPSAARPNYDATWPGFGGGSAVEAPTPTQAVEQAWAYDFREGAAGDVGVSEPLVVNGDIYLVANGELRVVDAATGAVKKGPDRQELRANVGGRSAYCNRPVYTEGVVIVPSDDGSLAAFTADTLVCIWKTQALEIQGAQGYQSLSSLTVSGSYVFAAFTTVGTGSVGTGGVRLCVDVRDGSVKWLQHDEPDASGGAAGYYWAGAAVSGPDFIVGNEAGLVQLVDGTTGQVQATLDVAAPIRAGIVAVPATIQGNTIEHFLVVSSDGVLHLVTREGGQLFETGSVQFATKSISTPVVSGGKVFVCGANDAWYGTLSVIDLTSLVVERTVRGGQGEAQSPPLVAVQGDNTYVYFTCNGLPGGVYGYHLGDETASTLFTPAPDDQGFCFASVVADSVGNLYYTNDTGRLFALRGVASVQEAPDVPGDESIPASAQLPLAPAAAHAALAPSAAHTPLAQTAVSQAEGGENALEARALARAGGMPAVAEASAGERTASGGALGSTNPWAICGIALGIAGLVGAFVYVLRSRQRLNVSALQDTQGN